MTLALLFAGMTTLILGGHCAAAMAHHRVRSPGRIADLSLALLGGAALLGVLCAGAAGWVATAPWRFDAQSLSSALTGGDPVRLFDGALPGPHGPGEWIGLTLLSLWLAIAAVLWLRDHRAQRQLRYRLSRSDSVDPVLRLLTDPAVDRAMRRWGATIPRGVRVAEIDPGLGPMTWGVRRPRVAIPSQSWDDSVLVHEMAHVVRGDALRTALLSHILRIGWFAPSVRRAAERIRLLIEVAVDDMVVRSGVDALDYADALLRHARLAAPGPAAGNFLADARSGSALGRRVSRLTGSQARDSEPLDRRRWSVALFLGGALVVGAVMHRPSPAPAPCAVGSGPVTTWRQLDPEQGSAELRWWSEHCRGSVQIRGPMLVSPQGQLVIPSASGARFRLVLDGPDGERRLDVDGGTRAGLALGGEGFVVVDEPVVRGVVEFLFRETGWDGDAWSRHLARTVGVEGLLIQSRLAHDPVVRAELVDRAIEEAGVAPFVELLRRESDAGALESLIGEVSGNGRRSGARRAAMEAALALK